MCKQFSVKEVKRLGHGNIARLVTSANKPGKHQSSDHTVYYETAVCGTKRLVAFLAAQQCKLSIAGLDCFEDSTSLLQYFSHITA